MVMLNMLVTMDFPVDVESVDLLGIFIGILKKGNHMYNQDQLRINLGNKPIPFQFPFHRFCLAFFCQRIVLCPTFIKIPGPGLDKSSSAEKLRKKPCGKVWFEMAWVPSRKS